MAAFWRRPMALCNDDVDAQSQIRPLSIAHSMRS
jgi:hypothetical protein